MRRALTPKVAVILAFVVLSAVVGCGRKGPPMPPEALTMPAPYDLNYALDGDTVTLTWQHPSSQAGIAECREFQVYLAKVEKDSNACADCPRIFSMAGTSAPDTFEYRQDLEPGYVYYFRIRAYTDESRYSRFSNTVKVSF